MREKENELTLVKPAALPSVVDVAGLSLAQWWELYHGVASTVAESSRKAQASDFRKFLAWFMQETKGDHVDHWTPRVAADFLKFMRTLQKEKGGRAYSDSTCDRATATLRPFAAWMHKHRPFPLGNPMEKIKNLRKGNNRLDLERALTKSEYRNLLDAADRLPVTGGRSKDRRRGSGVAPHERPQRKDFRPYRNRAIIYVLADTGMRRASSVSLMLDGIRWDEQLLIVIGKGGKEEKYTVSKQALSALRDYLEHEREQDAAHWQGQGAVFLAANSIRRGDGQLTPRTVNTIWNAVCAGAQVVGRTPHGARHYMGNRIIKKTGNASAVAKQLNHSNLSTALAYAGPKRSDLVALLDED